MWSVGPYSGLRVGSGLQGFRTPVRAGAVRGLLLRGLRAEAWRVQ